jgi:hypothetical protein
MGLRLGCGLRRLFLAAASALARLSHMLAAIHAAVAVPVGAAIALRVMSGHPAMLVVALARLVLGVALGLLNRRILRGRRGSDRKRDRGHEYPH